MTTITEDFVSFETSKLLKKKGFNEPCYLGYNKNGDYVPTNNRSNSQIIQPDFCLICCPTLQMTMKWMREIHNIFIKLEFDVDEDIQWHPSLTLIKGKGDKYIHTNELQWYDTYEQACEAAIKYCLENLI